MNNVVFSRANRTFTVKKRWCYRTVKNEFHLSQLTNVLVVKGGIFYL